MKKKIVTSLALGVCSIGLMAGNAMALPYGNGPSLIQAAPLSSGQVALQTVIDNVITGGPNISVDTDQSGVGGWTFAENDASSYLVSLGYAAGTATPYSGTLGIYDLVDSSKTAALFNTTILDSANFEIYNGTLKINSVVAGTGWSGQFGFYFDVANDGIAARYTEDSMNADGQNYAATFLMADGTTWDSGLSAGTMDGNNDWLLAFENNYWENDGNGIGKARDFNDGVFIVEDLNPVPEPASMLLFGAGLAGLAGIVTRRKQN